ncbi:HEPN domain-containing protein [Methanolobus vulcani]|uniref:HEPN domain-containing protein n=1 Tax=Methanolobus vulcani TaxID=38026 RepID=A0A7Z8KQK1_9EURY|nr:HEPN domain-containing protein [Methanolobus vulcani]TQD28277.1 HEPN domain-containing protein [Methanolobus vulcani]
MTSTEVPQIFLDIAKQDLKSSQLLFENKCYPQSIFLFQQSVEKAVKSMSIFTGTTNLKKAADKIGHKGVTFYRMLNLNWMENLKSMRKNKQKTEAFAQMLDVDSTGMDIIEVENDAKDLDIWTLTYIKNTQDHVELSDNELTDILAHISEIEEEYIYALSEGTDFIKTDEEWLQFIEEVTEFIKKGVQYYVENPEEVDVDIPENISEIVEEEFKRVFGATDKETWNQFANLILDSLYINHLLFGLSIIMDPHAISARYPDEDFNPMEFYTLELPLVTKLPKITAITEGLLVLLDNFYSRVQGSELRRLALENNTDI